MWAGALAGDLSRYRDFQLGSDLATVTKRTGANPSQLKVIHSRPVLIQELEWRPQSLGASSADESAKEVVFSFYDGVLFQIAIKYDRYETEGLTADDLVEAISSTYGTATKPPVSARSGQGPYGDLEDILARWQDPQYRFELIRSSYGPTYRLVGVLKKVEALAQAAKLEARRLDDREQPQREAAQRASDDEAAKATLDKARQVNKPKFRP